jgi:hypothetical protein
MSSERSEAGGKANRYLNNLQKFEFLFLIRTTILIFERVKQLNSTLQKKSFTFCVVKLLVAGLTESCHAKKYIFFNDLWKDKEIKHLHLIWGSQCYHDQQKYHGFWTKELLLTFFSHHH